MDYISLVFLAFCLLVMVIYYAVPTQIKWLVILLANLIFYASNGKIYLLYISVTTVVTWLATIYFGHLDNKLEHAVSDL